jgi:hypothetical protein
MRTDMSGHLLTGFQVPKTGDILCSLLAANALIENQTLSRKPEYATSNHTKT